MNRPPAGAAVGWAANQEDSLMSIRDVVSWRSRSPLARGGRVEHPMVTLQREMNRVFDDLFQGFEAGPVFGDAVGLASQAWPQMDIIDGEEAEVGRASGREGEK